MASSLSTDTTEVAEVDCQDGIVTLGGQGEVYTGRSYGRLQQLERGPTMHENGRSPRPVYSSPAKISAGSAQQADSSSSTQNPPEGS